MSSHDGRVDGRDGFETSDVVPGVAVGDQRSGVMAASAGGGLTLDEAESIAARRLRELAIRLGDDAADADDAEGDRAPFDADRHFRERLAERIATLSSDEAMRPVEKSDQQAICALPYIVTDALPLSALSERLAVWAGAGRATSTQLSDPIARENGLAEVQQPAAPFAAAEASAFTHGPSVREMHAASLHVEPQMRLVDLINEQRTLLDRLANISLAQEVARADGLRGVLVPGGQSDAELLFEVGTYAAQVVDAQEGDEAEAPAAISAEQLIAALEDTPPSLRGTAEAVPEPAEVGAEPGVAEHRPSLVQELAPEPAPERPPIIIERARAELDALANGEMVPHAPAPSSVIGFFAGLSLSGIIGVVLYFTL